MYSPIKYIVILLVLALSFPIIGQEDKDINEAEKNLVLEQSIELVAELSEDENIDYTTLFDVLSSYYDNPINLNRKDIREDLEQLRLLTDFQIDHIIQHKEKNGNLMTIYELQSIEGFDVQTIRNIMPFVTVSADFYSPHVSFNEMVKNASTNLFIRYSKTLEEQPGYQQPNDSIWEESPNQYALGKNDRLYTRFRFKYLNNLSFGITAEKDAGETFFRNKQAEQLFGIKSPKGFDFYSAHFYLHNIGKVKSLAIGDYHIQLGQGLTFWSGLAFGKSVNVMAVKRNALGIRPYASVDENNFLRGAAATLNYGKLDFTAFGSRKMIDANYNIVDTNSTFDGLSFTSFQTTGLHNTIGTLEDKKSLQETYAGGNISFNTHKLKLGITGVQSFYGGNVERNLTYYNQYNFNSNQNTVMGADYSFIHRNFNLYGEVSRSANGGMAQIHGLLAALDPKLSVSILYRNYARDYQSIRSNAFAESSTNTNEKGLFFGVEAKLKKGWIINAYMDQFQFPWMKFLTDQPHTYGMDAMLQARYRPSRTLDMYVRIRNRLKPKNTDFNLDDIDYVVQTNQWNIRYNIIYKISESVRLRNRVEFTTYHREGAVDEQGFMIYQDVMYKPLSSNFSFVFRYALFDTDSYNSRIYSYENDVLYYYAIPSYYNRGTRTYLTARYKVRKGIDVWLRWSQWYYNNVDVIGSGLNQINGNTKTEIRAMVRFAF